MHTAKPDAPRLVFVKRDGVSKKRSHHEHKPKATANAPMTTASTSSVSGQPDEGEEEELEEDEIEREFGVVTVCPEGRQVLVDMLKRRRESEAVAAAKATAVAVAAEEGRQGRLAQQRKMELAH